MTGFIVEQAAKAWHPARPLYIFPFLSLGEPTLWANQHSVPCVEHEPVGRILERGLYLEQCVDLVQHAFQVVDENLVPTLAVTHLCGVGSASSDLLGFLADVGFLDEGDAQLRPISVSDREFVAKLPRDSLYRHPAGGQRRRSGVEVASTRSEEDQSGMISHPHLRRMPSPRRLCGHAKYQASSILGMA